MGKLAVQTVTLLGLPLAVLLRAREVSLNLLSELHHRYGSEVSVFCSHDEAEFERLVEEAAKERD